jgi:hypothetical protein
VDKAYPFTKTPQRSLGKNLARVGDGAGWIVKATSLVQAWLQIQTGKGFRDPGQFVRRSLSPGCRGYRQKHQGQGALLLLNEVKHGLHLSWLSD